MKQYYVDNKDGEIITMKEIKRDNLSPIPVGYYEYRNSGMEELYIEIWYCGCEKYIEYAYSQATLQDSLVPLYVQRQKHFEEHGVKPIELYAYAVPPSEYNYKIEQYEKYEKGGAE